MLYLTDTHRGLVAVVFHQVIRVIKSPSHLCNDLHTRFLRQLFDLFIPAPRITIRVLLKHKMGYLPALENLG